MIDINKVESAIKLCTKATHVDNCNTCPYRNDYGGFPRLDYGETSCISHLLNDALSLIKELKNNDTCENCAMAVENRHIVHCKDCANYAPCKENMFNIQGVCMRMNQPTDNEYYCADGVDKNEIN